MPREGPTGWCKRHIDAENLRRANDDDDDWYGDETGDDSSISIEQENQAKLVSTLCPVGLGTTAAGGHELLPFSELGRGCRV